MKCAKIFDTTFAQRAWRLLGAATFGAPHEHAHQRSGAESPMAPKIGLSAGV